MSLVDPREPLSIEGERHSDQLDRDLSPREVLRDPAVRGEVIGPLLAFAMAAFFALVVPEAETLFTSLIAIGATATFGVFAVKWGDEAICVLRGSHTCHVCRDESERWEGDR